MDGDAIRRAREVLASAGIDFDLQLKVDFDRGTISGTLKAPLPLREFAEKVGGSSQWVLEWVPDLEFDSIELAYKPDKNAFALLAKGGTVGAEKPQAELFVGLVAEKPTPSLVGIDLAAEADLGGLPVVGTLLSGTSVGPLGVRYATKDFPAETLPPPAPQLPMVKKGLSLGLTVVAAGTVYPFSYGTGSGDEKQQLLAAPSEPSGGGANIVWFDVNRRFGPVEIGRIGIQADDRTLGLALDASLTLAALSLALTGFRVSFDKKDFTDISIGIEGLSVSVDSPSLQLEGGLVHRQGKPGEADSYDGTLVMQIGKYGISVIGSFTEVNGAVSMFVFGVAKGRFGGPPAFFVTGLAAGFGYNRGLRLPTVDKVAQFPLVELAQGSGGASPSGGEALQQLSEGGWIPPQQGSYWVAAGIQGTSFEIAKTFALLSVEWGSELVFALMGTSQITLPKPGEGKVYAKATLALIAVLRPAEGTFKVEAQLTPDSYVIDPDCKLSGGFAFWLWFGDNPHAGDFVITLGGYNPIFSKPDWYPSVPRLGFNWSVSSDLQIAGNAYFALTPTCAMAGGGLSVNYESGGLHAWLTAQADFIIWWRPFYFDVYIGVSVGASYSTHILGVRVTLSASLSADLHLWGPELAGEAHVKWWVISFTVPINGGGSPNPPGTVLSNWGEFEKSFLPQSVLTSHAAGGLLGEVEDKTEGKKIWQVRGHGFELAIQSAVPAMRLSVDVPEKDPLELFEGPGVGVYPLNLESGKEKPAKTGFKSSLKVAVTNLDTNKGLDVSGWTWEPTTTGVPEALWGLHNDGRPPLRSATVPGLVGATGVPVAPQPQGPGPFLLGLLEADAFSLALPLSAAPPVDGSLPQPGGDTRLKVGATIAEPAQAGQRQGIVDALNTAYGGGALVGGTLGTLAAKVRVAYQWGPIIGPLGTSGAPSAENLAARPPRPFALASRAAPPPRRRDAGRVRPLALFRRAGGGLLSHVADRHASPHDRLALSGALAEEGAVRLRPGTTFAWSVDPDARVAVAGDGAQPLRLTAVTLSGYVLADEWIPAGEEGERRLPDGTALLALGCDLRERPRVAGWEAASPLAQLSPSALLGEGCVVRPQAPHRLRHRPRRGSRGTGATSGRTLLDRCLVEGPDGAVPGFLETSLPPDVRTVVLSLRPDPGGEGPELAAAEAARVEWSAGSRPAAAAPVAPLEEGERIHLAYEVGEEGAPAPLRTLTHARAGWLHEGVFGFAEEPEEVLAAARLPRLRGTGPAPAADDRETLVTVR